MSIESLNEKQALKACIDDTIAFKNMYMQIHSLPEVGLLLNGFMTEIGMFTIESYDVITRINPEMKQLFDNDAIDKLRLSRHRAKLFDSKKDFNEVLSILKTIDENEIKRYKELNSNNIGSILPFLIDDMGITQFNGRFITTTHSTIYDFGPNFKLDEKYAFELGQSIGVYLQTVINKFDVNEDIELTKYKSNIRQYETKDIKSKKLYSSINFQNSNKNFAPALSLLLVRLNYTRYITSQFFQEGSLCLLRLRFVNVYHTLSSLRKIQSLIMQNDPNSTEKNFFKSIFACNDVKWLLSQGQLRNFLTHYFVDSKQLRKMPINFTRVEAIEILSGGIKCSDIDARLISTIDIVTNKIEGIFSLKADMSWLGRNK
uniref:hypothetical protein n=1 Tax=Psychrobacter sp. TaxID=56811 RepID=UPI0025E80231